MSSKKIIPALIILLLSFIILAGCQGLGGEEEVNHENVNNDNKNELSQEEQDTDIDIEPEEREEEEEELSLEEKAREVKANELGQVMFLMYHDIGEPESEWRRTPANFRKDLEVLYEEGYRPVAMNDFLDGNIDIPAGTSPVIITFDDGHKKQFNYLTDASGNLMLDPESAVGIMTSFSEDKPYFKPLATFYVYYPIPFRQKELIAEKYNFLVEKGMEIGNHTYSHANLRNISTEEAIKELALHQAETEKYLPGYRVRSLALTYGAYPQNEEVLYEGSYNDTSYHLDAVLLVGANPAPSPFHQSYNPYRLPRIRASEMKTEGVGMYDWIEYFQENPGARYISDGNPDTVAIPADSLDNLNEEALSAKELVVYETD